MANSTLLCKAREIINCDRRRRKAIMVQILYYCYEKHDKNIYYSNMCLKPRETDLFATMQSAGIMNTVKLILHILEHVS
jgi:hypothetical protein